MTAVIRRLKTEGAGAFQRRTGASAIDNPQGEIEFCASDSAGEIEGETMKKKIFLTIGLLLLTLWALVGAQKHSGEIGSYGNLTIGPYGNLKIGPYGNIVGLADPQANEVLSPIREGYEIVYRAKDSAKKSDDRVISVIGDQRAGELVTQNKQSTSSLKVVSTQDQTLEISSEFTYDDKAQQLTIDRRVKNTSNEPVELQSVREFIDGKLVVRRAPKTKPADLEKAFLGTVNAGTCVICPVDCSASRFGRILAKCPPPPPPCVAIWCPGQNGFFPPELVGRGNIDDPTTLLWNRWSESRSPHPLTIRPSEEVRFNILVRLIEIQ